MRILLPAGDRRATVRAFWLIMTAGFALVAGLGLTLRAGVPRGLEGAILVALVLGPLVFWQERLVWRLYRGWNRILARPVAVLAHRAILRLCFWVIRAAATGSGTRRMTLRPENPTPSAWQARSSLPPDGYAALFFAAQSPPAGLGWLRNYTGWACRTGNAWAVALLPFLALLQWCDPGEEKTFAANIYTLF
jgi:hypothetical protein